MSMKKYYTELLWFWLLCVVSHVVISRPSIKLFFHLYLRLHVLKIEIFSMRFYYLVKETLSAQ